MASSAVRHNSRLPAKLRVRVRAGAVLKLAIVFVGMSLALTACRKHAAVAPVDPNGPVEVVIPDHGVYTGAFMDFGDAEDDVTLETIEDFEEMVGKHQAIIVSSSYWGEQNFPADNLNVIWPRFVAARFLVALGQTVRGRSRP